MKVYIRSVGVACAAGVGDERVLDPSRPAAFAPPALPRFADRRVAACSVEAERYVGQRKSLKLMSRAAQLAVVAAREARPPEADRERAGLFLGVGMSGGEIAQLAGLLDASLDDDGAVDLDRMGRDGLPRLNPLLSFHVLNNMPLCHASIELGLGGPHGAIYGDALQAVARAADAVVDGRAPFALAGGADGPLTTVSLALAAPDEKLGEGAAILVVSADPAQGEAANPAQASVQLLDVEEQPLHTLPDVDRWVAADGEAAARLGARAIALADLVGETRAASGALGLALAVRILRADAALRTVGVATGSKAAIVGRAA